MNTDAAQPPPLPLPPRTDHRPALWAPVTWFCWFVVVVMGGFLLWMSVAFSPLDYLEQPARSLVRIGERNLDYLAAEADLAPGERMLFRMVGFVSADERDEIARAYWRVARFLDERPGVGAYEDDEALRACLVVLHAEYGEWDLAEEALDLLDATEPSDEFVRVVWQLYAGERPDQPVDEQAFLLAKPDAAPSSWTLDRLHQRNAAREGRSPDVERRAASTLERGRGLVLRARTLLALELTVLLSGLLWALSRWRFWHRRFPVAEGATVAPWSFAYGTGVLVRCLVVALLAQAVLILCPPLMHESMTLLSALPMLAVAHYYLFRPDCTTLQATFGMGPGRMHGRRLVLFSLSLTFVDQAGCLLIYHGTTWAGFAPYWEDGLPETLLFGSWPFALFNMLDGVVWAPLFEEIMFRGILYITLRTRYRPVPAAWMSGLLFGAVHLYSLPGFLEVTWTGVILAIGYERCRSLWPCIFAHLFNNLVYCLTMLTFYR
jgi:membrane protease YdiL (CAAX protease family)